MRPKIIDTFPFNDELDILEMRLVELDRAVDWFILVEATVDHQDHPKPLHFAENKERFGPWLDRIVHVIAEDLPSVNDYPDPWARELAQREHIRRGLGAIDAATDDVLLQSDVDEIPTAVAARNVRPAGFVSFEQRGHFFAVDWLHPDPWYGTVAGRAGKIQSFAAMRDVRNTCPIKLPNAGWHFSWLGGPDRAVKKLGSFCHPEYEERIQSGIDKDFVFWREGIHTDLKKMIPVDVDRTWPKWIRDGNAPATWYRPRG